MCYKFLSSLLFASLFSVCFANGATYMGSANLPAPKVVVLNTQGAYAAANMNRVSATIVPGSLKANIQRILRPYGWSVAWTVGYDFDFVGSVHIHAASIEAVLQGLLANYPLQAVFYQGNHVVEIRSRTL